MALQLEIGKTYLSNGGVLFTILSEKEEGIFTDGKNEWLDNGEFLSCYEEGNSYYDLVKEWRPR